MNDKTQRNNKSLLRVNKQWNQKKNAVNHTGEFFNFLKDKMELVENNGVV